MSRQTVAASPYAMGVGGTTVLGPGPNEIAWYAGGGGITFFEGVPAYQASAGGSFTGIDRGVPDVSLDADPNYGPAYRYLAEGYLRQGLYTRAQDQATRADDQCCAPGDF